MDFTKESLRSEMLAKRMAAHQLCRERAAQIVRDLFLSTIPFRPGQVIAGYWPLAGELDCVPLLHALAAKNYPICLPVVETHNAPLIFREWRPNMTLIEGFSGTRIPPEDYPELKPDILIIPLVAFDRAGYRLGYGGGYYDRTLHYMRPKSPLLAVGIAYAAQQVPQIPHDGRDEKLDWVITEDGAINCN